MEKKTKKLLEFVLTNFSLTGTLPDDNYKVTMEGRFIRRDTYSNFGHNWLSPEEIYEEFKQQQ